VKKKIGVMINALIIIAALSLVLYYTLKGDNLGNTLEAMKNINIGWLILCALGQLGYVACDSLAMWYFLRRQGYPISLRYSFFVSMIGQFY